MGNLVFLRRLKTSPRNNNKQLIMKFAFIGFNKKIIKFMISYPVDNAASRSWFAHPRNNWKDNVSTSTSCAPVRGYVARHKPLKIFSKLGSTSKKNVQHTVPI